MESESNQQVNEKNQYKMKIKQKLVLTGQTQSKEESYDHLQEKLNQQNFWTTRHQYQRNAKQEAHKAQLENQMKILKKSIMNFQNENADYQLYLTQQQSQIPEDSKCKNCTIENFQKQLLHFQETQEILKQAVELTNLIIEQNTIDSPIKLSCPSQVQTSQSFCFPPNLSTQKVLQNKNSTINHLIINDVLDQNQVQQYEQSQRTLQKKNSITELHNETFA